MRMPIFYRYQRHHGGYVFEGSKRSLVPTNPNAEIEEGDFSELALYEFLDATLGDSYPTLTEQKVLKFADRWGPLNKANPCILKDFEELALHIRSHRIRTANNALRKKFGVPKKLGFIEGRVTYIINSEGIIKHIFEDLLNGPAHIKEAIKALKKLQ